MRIAKIKLANKLKQGFGTGNRSLKSQLSFFTMLSDLIQNGFSIRQSIEFITTIDKDDFYAKVIIHKLSLGMSFSQSLKGIVDNNMYYQLMVAEQHGKLIQTLREVTSLLEFKYRQKAQIKSLMLYPVFLFIFLLMIIIGSQFFIIPQINQMGNTHSVLDKSIIWVLGGIGIIISLLVYLTVIKYRQLRAIERAQILIKLPLIGKIFRYYYQYYISSMLSLMLKSGLDSKAILEVLSNFDKRSFLFQLSNEIDEKLKNGKDILTAFSNNNLIPKEINMFMLKGDPKEKLSRNIFAFSKLTFNKMIKNTKNLIGMVQPLMFLIIGIGILGTYLSILMPMYNSLKGGY